MKLKIGNDTVPTSGTITYNGNNVSKVVYNSTVVWEKATGPSTVLEAAQTAILLHCDTSYESNGGYATITKSNYPSWPSTYNARSGFSGYLYVPAQAGTNNGSNWFNIGGLTTLATDKFTVECLTWPSMNNVAGNYTELVFGTGSAPDAIWRMQIKTVTGTTATAKISSADGTVKYESSAGGITSADGWYHLASTYHGNGTWSFFYNGTKVGTYAFTGASTGYNFTFIHTVGSGSDMGCFDEIAVHSYERYTANFTVPNEPYTISN